MFDKKSTRVEIQNWDTDAYGCILMNMGVQDRQLSATPSELITPETVKFICETMSSEVSERKALRRLLEKDEDAWTMLDDPRLLHSLSEAFVEEVHPRLGYYMLLRNCLGRAGITNEKVPAYLACLIEASGDLGNPFLGDNPLAIVIQSCRQKCNISSPETRKRLRNKIAHLCTVVLVLFRKSMERDRMLNEGPDADFYCKNAVYCYRKLADIWQEAGEEDLSSACRCLSENFEEIYEVTHQALSMGLIAPPV